MMGDAFKKHGQVFTVPLFHRRVTFLLGPEVSPHFYKVQAARGPQRAGPRTRVAAARMRRQTLDAKSLRFALFAPPPRRGGRVRAARALRRRGLLAHAGWRAHRAPGARARAGVAFPTAARGRPPR
jgi:hypothetical protein